MAQLALQLPPEVWVHVFGYLSEADRYSVRTCCKYFKKIVDHASLWKNSVVVLSFQNGLYNREFWATLRRRKIASVVVQSTKAKHWKQLALSLPTLTTVVMDQCSQESLHFLLEFPNLKRLAIRTMCSPVLIDGSIVAQPQQLTHLSMCNVQFPPPAKDAFTAAVSQFTNLTSLVCHQKGNHGDPVQMFHSIITCLPKLKHLSWSMDRAHPFLMDRYCNPSNGSPASSGGAGGSTGAAALTSLELVDYMDPLLSQNTMRFFPNLQTLAVFYKHSYEEINVTWPHEVCHLDTWLSDLRQLTTLIIVKGPPVYQYASSIPATVTSLTLGVGHSSEDMGCVAMAVPNLLHLHLDPWPSFLGARTGQIPKLFPKLRSLKLRHENVLEKDFLRLHRLQNLRHLQVLDAHPGPRPYLTELIQKLQALSNNRIQVSTSPHHRDLLACLCICLAY